ncbi:MAG: GtrA family protein [Candidatus Saccharibacteria bacterium]|nr:GtrA family protein [Candidatus Saccharibacteria bacterium]
MEPKTNEDKTKTVPKTSQHAKRYVVVGIILTVFNYGLYSILSNFIFNNSELLWLATFIATAITTILAYILHSKITWKERNVSKIAIVKFFIWNGLLTFPIGPGLTQFFSLFTPLYSFVYDVCQSLHFNFTYEFIQSTGAFVFTTAVTMIMNFLLYDKFVFGKKSPTEKTEKKEEKA